MKGKLLSKVAGAGGGRIGSRGRGHRTSVPWGIKVIKLELQVLFASPLIIPCSKSSVGTGSATVRCNLDTRTAFAYTQPFVTMNSQTVAAALGAIATVGVFCFAMAPAPATSLYTAPAVTIGRTATTSVAPRVPMVRMAERAQAADIAQSGAGIDSEDLAPVVQTTAGLPTCDPNTQMDTTTG